MIWWFVKEGEMLNLHNVRKLRVIGDLCIVHPLDMLYSVYGEFPS